MGHFAWNNLAQNRCKMLIRKSLDYTLYIDGNDDAVVACVSPAQIYIDCPSAAPDLYTSLIERSGI